MLTCEHCTRIADQELQATATFTINGYPITDSVAIARSMHAAGYCTTDGTDDNDPFDGTYLVPMMDALGIVPDTYAQYQVTPDGVALSELYTVRDELPNTAPQPAVQAPSLAIKDRAIYVDDTLLTAVNRRALAALGLRLYVFHANVFSDAADLPLATLSAQTLASDGPHTLVMWSTGPLNFAEAAAHVRVIRAIVGIKPIIGTGY